MLVLVCTQYTRSRIYWERVCSRVCVSGLVLTYNVVPGVQHGQIVGRRAGICRHRNVAVVPLHHVGYFPRIVVAQDQASDTNDVRGRCHRRVPA